MEVQIQPADGVRDVDEPFCSIRRAVSSGLRLKINRKPSGVRFPRIRLRQ